MWWKARSLQSLSALVDPGDEVLIASPYWVSYPAQVRLAEGEPVIVPTRADEGFRWDAGDVAQAITDKTVGIVINSPSNPSGAVYDAATLNALADLAVEHDLWIITDDIYSYITYDNVPFMSVLGLRPELKDRFILHGASKTYSMTDGVSVVGAPAKVIKKLGTSKVKARLMPQRLRSTERWPRLKAITAFWKHGPLHMISDGDESYRS